MCKIAGRGRDDEGCKVGRGVFEIGLGISMHQTVANMMQMKHDVWCKCDVGVMLVGGK